MELRKKGGGVKLFDLNLKAIDTRSFAFAAINQMIRFPVLLVVVCLPCLPYPSCPNNTVTLSTMNDRLVSLRSLLGSCEQFSHTCHTSWRFIYPRGKEAVVWWMKTGMAFMHLTGILCGRENRAPLINVHR